MRKIGMISVVIQIMMVAMASAQVTSFNTRTGAVTLLTADVTAALSNQTLNLGTGALTANGGLTTSSNLAVNGGHVTTTQNYLTLQSGANGVLLTQSSITGYLAQFHGGNGSDANYLVFSSHAVGGSPSISTGGADATIGLTLTTTNYAPIQVNNELTLLGLQPTLGSPALNINYNGGSAPTISNGWPSIINENANLNGTISSGTGIVPSSGYSANYIGIIDNIQTTSTGFNGLLISMSLGENTDGDGAAITASFNTNSNITNWTGDFVAGNFWAFASNNAGGTTSTGTTAKGTIFGINPQVVLNPGASYYQEMNPQENDVGLTATTQPAMLGGTTTAGDTVSLTFASSSISGSPITISAAVGTGNVLNNLCNTLEAAIDNSNALVSAGVSAICLPSSNVLTVNWPYPNTVTLSSAVTGAGTETVALGSITQGASVASKQGMDIVRLAVDSGAGALGKDQAFSIGSQNAALSGSFSQGIVIYNDAVAPSGTLIQAEAYTTIGGSNQSGYIVPLTHAVGIDFSQDAFSRQSGYSLKMPSMSVGGTGVLALMSTLLTPSSSGLNISAGGYVGTGVTITGGGGGGSGSTQHNYFVGDEVMDPYGGQYTVTGVNSSTGAITSLHTDNPPSVTGTSPGLGPFSLSKGSGNGATIDITWTQANTITLGETGQNINVAGLPVGCTGKPTGTLWNNSNVVSICP